MKKAQKIIITENNNKNTKDIDLISTMEIVEKINAEDKLVAGAVIKQKENIAHAIDTIVDSFRANKRLFYFGAGTSGRLGVLDASECPPTFGVDPDMVRGIIAGGDRALRYAIEGAEDDFELGQKDGLQLEENDSAVLISASGNPKYLLGVMKSAKEKGAKVIALTSNPKAKILDNSDIKIVVEVGSEALTGSSRMKSGTAQKMVLNMLSTASMIKIGKTYENYMIDVRATNEKLKKRAIGIVCDLAEVDEDIAESALLECSWEAKVAVLMLKKGIRKENAQELLDNFGGVLRKALNG